MEKPETKIPSLQERLANVQRLRGVYKFNRATVAAGLPRGTIAYTDEASAYNIRRWADAIGDLNPRFRDSDYAKSTKYGRLVAQPTFLAGCSLPCPGPRGNCGGEARWLPSRGGTWLQ